MLQLVALLAMEPPASNYREAVRDEKARIFKAMRPLDPSNVVLGQYIGYLQENGVAPRSQVETFAALKLSLDTWRWADVPFYIRTGKCLPETTTEILVEFKTPPRAVFGEVEPPQSNYYRFRLSPDVLISLGARTKVPGEAMWGERVELIVRSHHTDDVPPPYERLLGDAMRGDPMLFVREDAVEAAWEVADPILGKVSPVYQYAPNTWGPLEADRIMERDGGWHNPVRTEPVSAFRSHTHG